MVGLVGLVGLGIIDTCGPLWQYSPYVSSAPEFGSRKSRCKLI